MFDSVIIAEYMLSLAHERRIVLNVTKVQKLLYMAYGYFLAKENLKISEESPKAWPYGPVFPRTRKKVDYDNVMTLDDPKFKEIKEEKNLTKKLTEIIEKYSKFSASKLSDWSHAQGGPWHRTTQMSNFKWGITEIPEEYIKEYFLKLDI